MDKRNHQRERLLALFLLGVLLLNFPLLAVFSQPYLVWGIPILYLYLFSAWIVLIVLLRQLLRTKDNP